MCAGDRRTKLVAFHALVKAILLSDNGSQSVVFLLEGFGIISFNGMTNPLRNGGDRR